MTDTFDHGPGNPVLARAVRGDFLEREHRGAYAVCTPSGAIVAAAGDIDRLFLPRSAVKMIQALPMVESGAAAAMRLTPRHLALACASHTGSAAHAGLAESWLGAMGLGESHLMCGVQEPEDADEGFALRAAGRAATQLHNNCSGKHSGFLCLACHLKAAPEGYIAVDHPVQRRVAEAYAELTDQTGPLGWAADGCSAPNFAASVRGLARAMARYARPAEALGGVRAEAAAALRDAMMAHPFEVAGEGRANTALMRAGRGRVAMKSGAEATYVAILPGKGLGIALKIDDGTGQAATVAMTALLVRFGALEADDPAVAPWLAPKVVNRRGLDLGRVAATPAVTGH